MLIIPPMGYIIINHFCFVFVQVQLSAHLPAVHDTLPLNGKSAGLRAESVAQSEQKYLTLALGELPVMDFFGGKFHKFFFNCKLTMQSTPLPKDYFTGILMGKLKTAKCQLTNHTALNHFTLN